MEKKKSNTLLIISAVLLIAGLIFTIYAHNTSYAKSKELGKQLTAVKEQIVEEEASLKETLPEGAEITSELLTSLNQQKSKLTDDKLANERPYSFGLTFVFLFIAMMIKGIFDAVVGKQVETQTKGKVQKLALAGLMAALCYIGFAFFKIDIPVGPEKTAFHFGNVFCVLGALLLGGYWGGLAGAIGMTIGDLTTAYVTSAPKTFFLKLFIGLVVGFVAHKIFHITKETNPKKVTLATILATVAGMGFNVVADPVAGYFYKTYLLGVPQDLAKALAKIAALTTFVNAIVAVIAASIFYLALRPALKKSGLFVEQ